VIEGERRKPCHIFRFQSIFYSSAFKAFSTAAFIIVMGSLHNCSVAPQYQISPPFWSVKSASTALTLSYLPRNISPESDSANNIVIQAQALISLVVLAIVFCSAMLGMLVSRILPQNHLTDQTKGVVIVSTEWSGL
jgi:hypothetical protein